MATKKDELAAAAVGLGPLGRSQDDEPIFVLCARDRAAAAAVLMWAELATEQGASGEKVESAKLLAIQMMEWRQAHGGGKVPD